MTSERVIIHCIRPYQSAADEQFLTTSERNRAAQFRFELDRRLWIAYRVAIRHILSDTLGIDAADLQLETSSYGKPMLSSPYDGLHFNLSHCSDLALLAICRDGPVGIDIEQSSRAEDLLECMNIFCHPKEIAALPEKPVERSHHLLKIWTAKEAVLKALGTGLSHPPELVQVCFATGSSTSDTSLPRLEEQRIHRLDHAVLSNHVAMLSAPSSVTGIDIIAPLGID